MVDPRAMFIIETCVLYSKQLVATMMRSREASLSHTGPDPLNPEALESRAAWSYYLGDPERAARDLRSCLTYE